MPTYEYGCRDCRKRVAIFQTYVEYGQGEVVCPNCGSRNLKRLISRVRIARSEESRIENMGDPDSWGDIDEEDPRAMARMMRRMGKELGEDLPPEFDEVVDRLEAGDDPEDIEGSLPDMGGGGDMDWED
jgi:putative FmdB family regulatory protein